MHRRVCVLHRRAPMDSCRRWKGEARKSFSRSDRAWLSDSGDGGAARDAGRRHPERCRSRAELRDRQGPLSGTGAGWCAREVARRARRDRAEGRRAGDHENPEHAGGGGIREASPDRRNAGASDSQGSIWPMSTENRSPVSSTSEMSEVASRNTLALNPLVGIQGQDLVDSAGILFRAVTNEPRVATEQWLSFVGELGSILAGKSERAPKAGDRRFSDPAWKDSSLHSSLL